MVCMSAPLPMRNTAPSIASSIGAGSLVAWSFGRDKDWAAVASLTAGSITASTNDGNRVLHQCPTLARLSAPGKDLLWPQTMTASHLTIVPAQQLLNRAGIAGGSPS